VDCHPFGGTDTPGPGIKIKSGEEPGDKNRRAQRAPPSAVDVDPPGV